MGAYLYFQTNSNPDKVNDYLETNETQKKLREIDEQGIFLIDSQHLDWVKENRPDLLEWETKKLSTGDIKTSGGISHKFSDAGYDDNDLLEMWTMIFEQLNERFEMKYYSNSCALGGDYFSLEQMKRFTQNGKLLSGKTSKSDRARELYDKYSALFSEPEKELFDISIVRDKDSVLVDGSWRELKYVPHRDQYMLKWQLKSFNGCLDDIVEKIEGHRKYIPKIRYSGSATDVESYIINENGTLIYLETIGQENMVKSITSVLMQGRMQMNDHTIDASFGYFTINKAGNKRKMIALDDGMAHAILYHSPSINDTNFSVLIGRDKDELINSFSAWMEKSQPLPYPKELTKELYSKFQNRGKLIELESLNIEAIEIDLSILDDEFSVLQEMILEVCKENSLISPDAKPIKQNAPLPQSNYLTVGQVQKIYSTLNSMPKTYELEDLDVKPIGLKLFGPNFTYYVVEADKGCEEDEFTNEHTHCFGYVVNETDASCSEWGYINIPYLLSTTTSQGFGFEQDLHFEDMYIDSRGNVGSVEELENSNKKVA